MPRQEQPPYDESHAADGRDGAQNAVARDRQQVKAAAEDHDPDGEHRAHRSRRALRKRAGARQNRHDQHAQRVDEMVEDRLLIDAHRIIVEPAFQTVSAERPEDYRKRQQHGADQAPVHVLLSESWNKRCN